MVSQGPLLLLGEAGWAQAGMCVPGHQVALQEHPAILPGLGLWNHMLRSQKIALVQVRTGLSSECVTGPLWGYGTVPSALCKQSA